MKGKVLLVGAGPGDPELLTLKALRAIKTADIILHDELIGPEILALASKNAQLHPVGKRCGKKSIQQEEINARLVQCALLGLQVVRLKGGDPLLFGRAGEEIEALREAGVEVEIIPGITSALAAAANARIPLTHRHVASALVFLTGHSSQAANDWPASLPPDSTIVIYMPGYSYEIAAQRLRAAGLSASTPCAIVSQAALSGEQIHRTTLELLPQSPHLPAPTLLIVGEVVRFADHASLREQFSLHDFVSLPADAGIQERSE